MTLLGGASNAWDPPSTRTRLPRRRLARVVAFAVAILLHVALLTLWRTSRPPQAELTSNEIGAGGISLSLVSGHFGGSSDRPSAIPFKDVPAAEDPIASDATTETTEAQGVGDSAKPPAEAASAPTLADSAGVEAASSGAASAASLALGSDAWARASFFPSNPIDPTSAALWAAVRRCYHPSAMVTQPLSMIVVLDSTGVFLDAYPQNTPAGSPAMDDAFQNLHAALVACGPYPGLGSSLASRILLVTQADDTTLAAAPG